MMRPVTGDGAALLGSLRIRSQGDVPIYLQLKHQFSYLITTSRLPGGTRLPTVRSLAADLAINQHTVGQAYRELQAEGLIESFPGRGTFVRQFDDVTAAESARLDLLSDLLRGARRRARALGFSDGEIEQHLAALVNHEAEPCRVVFVDRVPHIARKYAARLEHHAGAGLRAVALTIAEMQASAPASLDALGESHYLFAFARNVPALEHLLGDDAANHEIVTIVSEVVRETVAALAGLTAGTRATLLTEERFVHAALDLLARHSAVDLAEVAVFTPGELHGFRASAESADVVLYTFGVTDTLEGQTFSAPSFELVFDMSPDSVDKVRRMLV